MPGSVMQEAQAQAPAFLNKEPRRDDALREEQRQEALRREQATREELRQEQPQREPPAREEPRIDTKALLDSAGLVMIETDRSKAPQPIAAEEPQPLGRPRRERPQPQSQDDELVQIETRK